MAFVLPGFVTVLLQERTFKSTDESSALDRLLRIIWYSVWSYVLLAIAVALASIWLDVDRPGIVRYFNRHTRNPAGLVLLGALIVLVPSLAIAETTRRWHASALREKALDKLKINARHMVPTAWDHYFGNTRDVYVRATFADGRRVLGYYGEHSFAAYAKDGGDLYLERLYAPDSPKNQFFGDVAHMTNGVWIKAGEAVWIEFYTPETVDEPAEQPTTEPPDSEPPGEAGWPSAAAAEPDSTQATVTKEAATPKEGN